jgi:hypothetical protein
MLSTATASFLSELELMRWSPRAGDLSLSPHSCAMPWSDYLVDLRSIGTQVLASGRQQGGIR